MNKIKIGDTVTFMAFYIDSRIYYRAVINKINKVGEGCYFLYVTVTYAPFPAQTTLDAFTGENKRIAFFTENIEKGYQIEAGGRHGYFINLTDTDKAVFTLKTFIIKNSNQGIRNRIRAERIKYHQAAMSIIPHKLFFWTW